MMGTIYKVSKPVGFSGGWHDFLVNVRDNGEVRIIRGGPDGVANNFGPYGFIIGIGGRIGGRYT